MKCIVFKVRGDYARFRKSYTTTSALTYLTIHPIAIRGLIGAILGIDRNNLHKETKDIDVAIQVVNEIRKDMQSFNLVNMKSADKFFRFPSNVEFLRNVEYKIFIKCEENKLKQIKNTLIEGEYIFTPYIGASEHIAKLEYEDEYECIQLNKEYHMIDSIIDVNNSQIEFDEDIILTTDNIPTKNNEKREYIEYKKIIFTTNRKKINAKCENIYKVGGYNVTFI